MAKKALDESLDKLNDALSEIKAQMGKDTIRTFNQHIDTEIIPTDFYEFNLATNLGGLPMGKLIEISGPESSGKTTLAWQLASQISRRNKKKILFLDYEMATSKEYLKKLGVPVEDVIFALPEDSILEDGFNIMDKLLPTGAFCAAIVDSLAAMVPKAEYDSVEEKGLAGSDMMLKAKILSKALRVMGPHFRKSGADVFFINHLMAKPQQKGPVFMLGEPEDTPGGKALKHHCDLRISLKPLGYVLKQVASDKDPKKKVNIKIGRDIRVKFIKNRVGEPFGEGTMTLRNGKGFDIITSAIKRGIAEGIIIREKGGDHFIKDDPTIKASSYNNFWNLFAVNPKLTQIVLDKLNGKAVKYESSEFDLSVNTRDVKASEIGASEEDDAADGTETTGEGFDQEVSV